MYYIRYVIPLSKGVKIFDFGGILKLPHQILTPHTMSARPKTKFYSFSGGSKKYSIGFVHSLARSTGQCSIDLELDIPTKVDLLGFEKLDQFRLRELIVMKHGNLV
jgi:hypothetical protein